MKFHETRLRVRYAETDQMGVVYHAHYLVWMEMGRVEYCRSRGMRYRDMEEQDGILLAVAEANCRYLSPAKYDDEVVVRTRIGKAHRRLVRFEYEMVDAGGERMLARGHTTHLFLDREMKPANLPRKYYELFGLA